MVSAGDDKQKINSRQIARGTRIQCEVCMETFDIIDNLHKTGLLK